MTAIVVDLDTPDTAALERLWWELNRRHQVRDVDPGLRKACEMWISLLDDRALAADLTDELAVSIPEVFIDARWQDVLPRVPHDRGY